MEIAMALVIENIRKSYNTTLALNDCSITLEKGLYGLLGPNGAGKSTLIKILTGNLMQDSGDVRYNNSDIRQLGKEYRKKIGYMPQEIVGYPHMSVQGFMEYMSVIKGISKGKREKKEEISFLLEKVNLIDYKRKKFGNLSGGMKRRVLFAQALLGNPEILILDEPTAGLDPKERIKMRNMIAELSSDKIVLLATHIVRDVECVASQIILLQQGSVLLCTSPEELLNGLRDCVWEVVCSQEEVKNLSDMCVISNMRQDSNGVALKIIGDSPPEGYVAVQKQPTLDDVYMKYFGNSNNRSV